MSTENRRLQYVRNVLGCHPRRQQDAAAREWVKRKLPESSQERIPEMHGMSYRSLRRGRRKRSLAIDQRVYLERIIDRLNDAIVGKVPHKKTQKLPMIISHTGRHGGIDVGIGSGEARHRKRCSRRCEAQPKPRAETLEGGHTNLRITT